MCIIGADEKVAEDFVRGYNIRIYIRVLIICALYIYILKKGSRSCSFTGGLCAPCSFNTFDR